MGGKGSGALGGRLLRAVAGVAEGSLPDPADNQADLTSGESVLGDVRPPGTRWHLKTLIGKRKGVPICLPQQKTTASMLPFA